MATRQQCATQRPHLDWLAAQPRPWHCNLQLPSEGSVHRDESHSFQQRVQAQLQIVQRERAPRGEAHSELAARPLAGAADEFAQHPVQQGGEQQVHHWEGAGHPVTQQLQESLRLTDQAAPGGSSDKFMPCCNAMTSSSLLCWPLAVRCVAFIVTHFLPMLTHSMTHIEDFKFHQLSTPTSQKNTTRSDDSRAYETADITATLCFDACHLAGGRTAPGEHAHQTSGGPQWVSAECVALFILNYMLSLVILILSLQQAKLGAPCRTAAMVKEAERGKNRIRLAVKHPRRVLISFLHCITLYKWHLLGSHPESHCLGTAA